jgi:hypothetical protein
MTATLHKGTLTMKFCLPLLALVATVLIGCSDPGDELVTVGLDNVKFIVKVGEQTWKKKYGTWTCAIAAGDLPVKSFDDYKKVQAYVDRNYKYKTHQSSVNE